MNIRIDHRIRALSSNNFYTHSLYKKLNLPQSEDLYDLEPKKFMYLYYDEKSPKIFYDSFKKITEFHSYHTRQVSDFMLFLPRMLKTSTQKSVSYKGTKIWSKVKLELKNLYWNAFKKHFKESFIEQY